MCFSSGAWFGNPASQITEVKPKIVYATNDHPASKQEIDRFNQY